MGGRDILTYTLYLLDSNGQLIFNTDTSSAKPCSSSSKCLCKQNAAQASQYFERTSGLCTDGGGSYIGTIDDCDEGADVLEWPATFLLIHFFEMYSLKDYINLIYLSLDLIYLVVALDLVHHIQ